MLGVGPGSLPSDAHMLGIEPVEQRRMMEESVEAMMALLAGKEPVTRQTDWFTLRDARLQLRPYTHTRFEIAAAATFSPAGPRLAGRFGLGLLSIGATAQNGFDVLSTAWPIMEQRAAEFGTTVDRRAWRLVGPMHIAESEDQARHDVTFGLPAFHRYFQLSGLFGVQPASDDLDDVIDALISSGFAVIGTPDQAIGQIERLQRQAGGFGAFLFMTTEWADRAATLKSYELFARYVMPRFQGSSASLEASWDWMSGRRDEFRAQVGAARTRATVEHEADQAARAGGAAVS
jgi:limonene 1,2-monooxygenase